MASADVIVSALRDMPKNAALDRYDESVCNDIKDRLDSKLKDLSITERALFARNNISVMEKWETVFPKGISECLSGYFTKKATWAPKMDPRFPNTNQAKTCFVNYVDYQRCIKLKGEDYKDCDYFRQAYKVLCPEQWVEKFDEQLANDAFPVDI